MLINTGVIYKFTFLPNFKSLDGIYAVTNIMTFEEMLVLGIDLFADTYAPLGIPKDTYEKEVPLLRVDRMLKLEAKVDGSELIIPFSCCSVTPDPNVNKYLRLILDIDLGVFDNLEQLEYVANALQENISASVGVDNAPDITKIGEVWMTEGDYALIEADRKANTSKILNYFSETIELRRQLDHARATIVKMQVTLKKVLPVT